MAKGPFILLMVFFLSDGCDTADYDYRDAWVRRYHGSSRHWISYPVNNMIGFFESGKIVDAVVIKSDIDSSMSISIFFEDSTGLSYPDIHFGSDGIHESSRGGGSTYSSLRIILSRDSMLFRSFYKCGIPCSGGVDFSIPALH